MDFYIYGNELWERFSYSKWFENLVNNLIWPSSLPDTNRYEQSVYFHASLREGKYHVKRINGIGDWDDFVSLI
jgi:hypothetical protein